jgi:hypothetical protein
MDTKSLSQIMISLQIVLYRKC